MRYSSRARWWDCLGGVWELSCKDLLVRRMDSMLCCKPALVAEMAAVLGQDVSLLTCWLQIQVRSWAVDLSAVCLNSRWCWTCQSHSAVRGPRMSLASLVTALET